MKLIHSKTFELQEFFDSKVPEYAILSHCWGEKEVSYQEFLKSSRADPKLKKIIDCCSLARDEGLDWVWVDTCCIDKSSSAELSEAINSMFSWYNRAQVCFVFLADLVIAGKNSALRTYDISECRWFTRGWTLQELLAPHDSLAKEIVTITGIPEQYLMSGANILHASVAQRMSWASTRLTTRVEDTAYCLLGIFDVNMPLLYGEGDKAFYRLQQAILAQSDDESIFVWLSNNGSYERGILAESPLEFAATGHVRQIHCEHKRPPAVFTSRGLEIYHTYYANYEKMSDQFLESIFGRLVFSAGKRLELRLDCEMVDKQDDCYWIGVSIGRNPITGKWFREDSSKLLYSRQKSYFKRRYPAFVGYKKIYIETISHLPTSDSLMRISGSRSVLDTFAEYNRSFATHLFWSARQMLYMAPITWLFSPQSEQPGLSGPYALVSWAYLTMFWDFHGRNSDFPVTMLILGAWSWQFDLDSYFFRNFFITLLAQVPMSFLHVFFDAEPWKAWTREQRFLWEFR